MLIRNLKAEPHESQQRWRSVPRLQESLDNVYRLTDLLLFDVLDEVRSRITNLFSVSTTPVGPPFTSSCPGLLG